MLLRWNMLFFDFCVRYLRLFDCFNTGKTVLPKNAKLGRHNGAAKNAASWHCRNSAAILAASMVISAKLAASMVQICQTCSKYGSNMPNLQQVWFKYAKLAVSMAIQAILGAFPAALGSMSMLVGLLAYFVVTLLWLLKLRINAVCKSAGSCSTSRL